MSPGNVEHATAMPVQSQKVMTPGGVDIPGVADITRPIIRDMPKNESDASKATSAIGGVLGGMCGGNPFGGGSGNGASRGLPHAK